MPAFSEQWAVLERKFITPTKREIRSDESILVSVNQCSEGSAKRFSCSVDAHKRFIQFQYLLSFFKPEKIDSNPSVDKPPISSPTNVWIRIQHANYHSLYLFSDDPTGTRQLVM